MTSGQGNSSRPSWTVSHIVHLRRQRARATPVYFKPAGALRFGLQTGPNIPQALSDDAARPASSHTSSMAAPSVERKITDLASALMASASSSGGNFTASPHAFAPPKRAPWSTLTCSVRHHAATSQSSMNSNGLERLHSRPQFAVGAAPRYGDGHARHPGTDIQLDVRQRAFQGFHARKSQA
jgi:hypothetical protein